MKSNHGAMGQFPQSNVTPGNSIKTREQMERDASGLQIAMRAAIGGTILLAAIAVSLMLSSCGGDSKASSSDGVAVADPAPTTLVRGVANPTLPVASTGGQDGSSEMSSKPLPPDVVVSVLDTLFTPGSAVEIVAQTTVDAVEVLLSDGLHEKQPFVYDVEGKVWRTTYRVPLRPSSNRIGVSVTATNDANRWRRVWVFLNVAGQTDAPENVPATSEEQTEDIECYWPGATN